MTFLGSANSSPTTENADYFRPRELIDWDPSSSNEASREEVPLELLWERAKPSEPWEEAGRALVARRFRGRFVGIIQGQL